ncbi:MAG: type II secretion system protein [Patescibacteria group bacterium]
MTMRRNQAGFTLIELLVVIAIIGILAALILAAFGSVQKGSRDTKRKSDLHQVGIALANYAANHADRYPVRTGEVDVSDLTELTSGGFISVFPDPPPGSADAYTYVSDAVGNAYGACVRLEKDPSMMLKHTESGLHTVAEGACTPGN